MANLTACGNNIKPYTVDSSTWLDKGQWDNILASTDSLMNMRYSGYSEEILNGSKEYIESFALLDMKQAFENENTSSYYDIEEQYQSEVDILRTRLKDAGAILNDDLTVTYNGITQDKFSGVANDTSVTEETAGISPNEVSPVQMANTMTDVINSETEQVVETTEEITDETLATEEVVSDVIEDSPDVEEIIDPRTTDLINLKGSKIWSGKSQGEIDAMTAEENDEFNRIYAELQTEYEQHYKGIVKDIEYKNSIESEDTGDTHTITDIVEYDKSVVVGMTSEFVQVVDGRHVISWRYVIDHFNKNTGRFDYNILGANKFIEVEDAASKLSPLVNMGDEAYNFKRVKYELLDNNIVNIEYMSYVDGGTLKYDLVVCGKLKDGKLQLDSDNVRKFLDIYE